MSPEMNARVQHLAKQRNTVQQIAERLGVSLDRVRSSIRRAEERGDVPPGTLAACTPNRYKTNKADKPPAKPVDPIRAVAPARSQAARYGVCTICKTTADVVVDIGATTSATIEPERVPEGVERIVLCDAHAEMLQSAVQAAYAHHKSRLLKFGSVT